MGLNHFQIVGIIVPYSIFVALVLIVITISCVKAAAPLQYVIAKVIFIDLKSETKHGGDTQYRLYGAIMKTRVMKFLCLMSGNVVGLAFFISLNVFLVNVTNTCVDDYTCYDENNTLIETCSDYMGEVTCYKLTYNIQLALAAWGGMLSLATKAIQFYSDIVLPILRYVRKEYKTWVVILCYFLLFTVPSLCINTLYIVFIYFLSDKLSTRDKLHVGTNFVVLIFISSNFGYVLDAVILSEDSNPSTEDSNKEPVAAQPPRDGEEKD